MDLKQLEYFLAVAEHLNFSRAAESLYVSQPALSYQIAELEKNLGQTLFVRDRRNVSLTPAGAALVEPVQNVLSQVFELPETAAKGFLGTLSRQNSLKLAYDVTEDHFECSGITDAVAHFIRDNPNNEIKVCQLESADIKDRIINRELDIGIIVLLEGERIPPGLSCEILRADHIVLVIRKDLPYSSCIEVLNNMRLAVVAAKPRRTRSLIMHSFTEMGISPKLQPVDSMPAGFTYTSAGQCAMLLPSTYFSRHGYSNFKAIEIPDNPATLSHAAIWNEADSNSVLLDLIATLVAELN